MINNRRRRVRSYMEDRIYKKNMNNIENDDAIACAGYLYYIAKDLNNETVYEDENIYPFLEKLITRLQLNERFGLVVESYVSYLAESGVLSYYCYEDSTEENETELSPMARRRKEEKRNLARKFVFAVDEEISFNYEFYKLSEEKLNFIRCMTAKGTGLLSQILYFTFFTKATVMPRVFHDVLPIRFEKKIHDISKIDFLKTELELSDIETEYLLLRYRKFIVENITEVFDEFTKNSIELYTKILGITKNQFQQIVRRDSKIRQFGFIDEERIINTSLIDCIDAQDLSLYFTDCVKTQNLTNVYDLDSFSVPEKNTKIYKSLLKSENPVSVILYGAPGSGKTEYAKSLIKASGKKALIFKNEAEALDNDEILGRLNCLLSLNRKDTVLIIDEADSILSTSMRSFFGLQQSSKKKGVVNKMLENSQNKVIWIVNYKSQIDESTLRRFTVSYKFEQMSRSMLESIAIKKLDELNLELDTKQEIVKMLSQYKVTGASVDNLVKTINSMEEDDGKNLIENIGIVLKDNASLLHGDSKKMRSSVRDSYDMSVLNTSIPSQKIIDMLQNAKKFAEKNPENGAVRMLFYGLSGTGKTEFARYISEVLGKEILLKRASDIFDKYVGGTEQNIAAAFSEAARNDEILLFDEADSFFSDRKNSVRNYERTQVNEFLTQLEEFPGIVICTTNLRNIMDPAMLRRFHITVDFKALTQAGIEKLLHKFFGGYEFDQRLIKKLVQYETVTPGDFGRLCDTIKFMNQDELSAEYIIEQLCEIQKEKNENGHKPMGFCA